MKTILSEWKMISIDKFRSVVENAPLIAIDLIVEKEGKILLGKRKNKPAQGYYFTLGGRILKSEKMEKALFRISHKEIGYGINFSECRFHGIYEHHYPDSFVDDAVSTHYVVLAYRIDLREKAQLPEDEHSEYMLFSIDELMEDPNVHGYVKDYFKGMI